MDILLVDDHLTICEGTKMIIDKHFGYTTKVEFVTDPLNAKTLLTNKKYDLLIFDLKMPRMNGIELTKQAVLLNQYCPIIIYTGCNFLKCFSYLIEAGASGFISKKSSKDEFISAIDNALRGKVVIPMEALSFLRRNHLATGDGDIGELTKQEITILEYVSYGNSSREISKKLYLSQRTIDYHLGKIFKKLKVHSRMDAVTKAIELGLIFNLSYL